MKNNYVFVLLCFLHTAIFAQNVGINTTGATPNVSALLDVSNFGAIDKKGLLIPRMTLDERTAMDPLPAAAQGLLVYQTNGVEGFYYNTSLSTIPNWVYVFNSVDSDAWLKYGNSNTFASTSNIGSYVSDNFIGTTDNVDFVMATNSLERMRITKSGLIGINTISPITSAFVTINPTTNAIPSGIYFTNASTANSEMYGIGSVLSQANVVSGYNAFRNSSGKSYGIYGINGTTSTYVTNANTWAAFLQGRTVISSESEPTSAVGTDLEVRNTSTGSSPVNLGLRQTTSNTSAGNVLGNLFFGDNHSATAQAQISAVRSASGGSGDLPTDLLFHTTPDASSTLTERMRLTNTGNLLIGATTSVNNAKLSIKDGHIQVSQTTAPTITVSSNAGTGASASLSLNSNDVVGNIVFTTGNGAFSAGVQCTITFNRPYSKAPIVIISPANANAAQSMDIKAVFTSSSTTGYTISFASNPGPSIVTFEWNYMIIEP